eukprot:scaffold529_cov308-Pinguiococcus_pyrenoidosus.AAC.76
MVSRVASGQEGSCGVAGWLSLAVSSWEIRWRVPSGAGEKEACRVRSFFGGNRDALEAGARKFAAKGPRLETDLRTTLLTMASDVAESPFFPASASRLLATWSLFLIRPLLRFPLSCRSFQRQAR